MTISEKYRSVQKNKYPKQKKINCDILLDRLFYSQVLLQIWGPDILQKLFIMKAISKNWV